jgi:hypothetical protein
MPHQLRRRRRRPPSFSTQKHRVLQKTGPRNPHMRKNLRGGSPRGAFRPLTSIVPYSKAFPGIADTMLTMLRRSHTVMDCDTVRLQSEFCARRNLSQCSTMANP